MSLGGVQKQNHRPPPLLSWGSGLTAREVDPVGPDPGLCRDQQQSGCSGNTDLHLMHQNESTVSHTDSHLFRLLVVSGRILSGVLCLG